MKLNFEKLEYKNIKVTEHRTVDLSGTGLIMVVGPNGGGKSTIADALKVALLDRTLDKKAGHSILSRNKKNGWVKVWFTENKHLYCIENLLSQNKSVLNVYKDNIQLNGESGHLSGKNAVKNFMKKYFTESLFNNVLYFSSNRTRSGFFLDLSEPDQKKFLEEVLPNFLLYRKAEEIVKETLAQSKTELLKLENECSIIAKEIVVRKENLEKERINIEEFEKSLTDKHQKIQLDIKKINEWLEAAQQAQKKIAEFRRLYAEKEIECKKLIETREQLEKSVKSIEEKLIAEFNDKKNAYNAENTSLHKEEIEANEKLKNKLNLVRKLYDDEVDKLYSETKSIQSELKASIEELDKQLFELTTKAERLKSETSRLDKEIREIKKSIETKSSICPICKNQLTNYDELTKSLQNKEKDYVAKCGEIVKVEKSISLLKQRKDNVLESIAHSEKECVESLEKLKAKKVEYEKILNDNFEEFKQDLQKRLKIVETKLNSLELAQKRLLEENVQRLQVLKNLKKALDDEEKSYKELSNIRDAILKFESAYSHSQILERNKEIENLNALIASDFEELKKRKEQHTDNIEKCVVLEKSRKTEVSQKYKEEQSNLETYEYLTKVFSHNGIRSWYLDLVIPTFNAILRKNCSTIAPNFRVSLLREGSDVQLHCKNFINGSDFDGFSSGERSLMSLVVILSISELLSSYEQFCSNVVVFDEVFDSLDRKNSMIVLDALYLLSQKKKVILLTHNESYKNSELANEIIEV